MVCFFEGCFFDRLLADGTAHTQWRYQCGRSVSRSDCVLVGRDTFSCSCSFSISRSRFSSSVSNWPIGRQLAIETQQRTSCNCLIVVRANMFLFLILSIIAPSLGAVCCSRSLLVVVCRLFVSNVALLLFECCSFLCCVKEHVTGCFWPIEIN